MLTEYQMNLIVDQLNVEEVTNRVSVKDAFSPHDLLFLKDESMLEDLFM